MLPDQKTDNVRRRTLRIARRSTPSKPSNAAQPPLFRKGYAVFVKLWDLKPRTPADVAQQVVKSLDEVLLQQTTRDRDAWFPSPYGGAIIVGNIEDALSSAEAILRSMTAKGHELSIAVAWGQFERVRSVTRWNVC